MLRAQVNILTNEKNIQANKFRVLKEALLDDKRQILMKSRNMVIVIMMKDYEKKRMMMMKNTKHR